MTSRPASHHPLAVGEVDVAVIAVVIVAHVETVVAVVTAVAEVEVVAMLNVLTVVPLSMLTTSLPSRRYLEELKCLTIQKDLVSSPTGHLCLEIYGGDHEKSTEILIFSFPLDPSCPAPSCISYCL